MAVKTVFSGEEFKEALRYFGMAGDFRAEPVARGTVQTNYIITTDTEKCVLRVYENRSAASVEYEIELLKYLADRGICVAQPLKHGQHDKILRGKPYLLSRFMPGEVVETPNDAQQAGIVRMAARIAELTQGIELPRSDRMRHVPEDYFERAKAFVDSQADAALRRKLDWYGGELAKLDMGGMPRGACHGDMAADNMLFDGNSICAVLDFDHAADAPLCWDAVWLADPFVLPWDGWREWPEERSPFDFGRARGIMSIYSGVREFSRPEREHLWDVLKMQVLLDCLWFFGRGTDEFYEKRKLELLEQLGREEFARLMLGE